MVDVLIVNEGEAEALGGVVALCEHVTVIKTRGAEGSTVYPKGAASYDVEAFPVAAVDTTGAGDAFCGGLAAALARGAELRDAVREGAAAGAIVALHRGAQTDELNAAAVRQLVADGSLSPAKR